MGYDPTLADHTTRHPSIGDTVNLEKLTDEELDQLRQDVLIEQERRQAVATIPAQIADLEAKFLAGGGDPAELRNPT